MLMWQSYETAQPSSSRLVGGRVWVSAEVREEIREILLMLDRSAARFREILIDAPAPVLDRLGALPERVAGARVRLMPYHHSTKVGVAAKLRGLAQFILRIARRRPDVLFSGFSMMRHRLAAGIFRVPHVAYLRGVVFDPQLASGISDRIRVSALSRLVPGKAATSYHADFVLTVGDVNRDFLIARGIPAEHIALTGPVWLHDSAPPLPSDTDAGRIYFLTTAWQAHGLLTEHEAQLRITRRLAEHWRHDARFVMRVHPRDRYDYESDDAYRGVALDRRTPEEFLRGLRPADLIIAPLSTLAFEAAYLGGSVVFYSDDVATKAYNHVYERLGIDARSVEQILADDLRPQRPPVDDIFSPIDFHALDRVLGSLAVHTETSRPEAAHRVGQ